LQGKESFTNKKTKYVSAAIVSDDHYLVKYFALTVCRQRRLLDRQIRARASQVVGCDYRDVLPTRGIFSGIFKGNADSKMSVAVRVATADSAEIETKKETAEKPPVFQNSIQRQAAIQTQQEQKIKIKKRRSAICAFLF
jgi:hypothetical protein